MIQYRLSRPDGSFTAPLGAGALRRKVRGQMSKTGPRWRHKLMGANEWGNWRQDRDEELKVFLAMCDRMPMGRVAVMDGEDHPYNIKVRKVETEPPVIQTQGNSDIDRIYTYIIRKYGNKIDNAGICVRKNVAGTSTPSQHNPWVWKEDPGANAWDFFMATMDLLYDTARDMVRNADELQLGRVIVGDRIWDPSQGWHDYHGVYHRHIHCEGRPERSGAIGSC